MVKHIAVLTFGDDFDPDEFKRLVVSLGGTANWMSWAAVLGRQNSTVWIDVHPPDESSQTLRELNERGYTLEFVPRYQVFIHVSSHGQSEWLAAEIVLAAKEKWNLALEGFDEKPIALSRFERNIARRTSGLFWSKNPSP